MGKSRSTALIIAYLLSRSLPISQAPQTTSSQPLPSPNLSPLTPTSALSLIRQTRPFAEPNSGFMHQLHLYHQMSCPPTLSLLEAHPIYQHWLYQRTVEASIATGLAPAVGDLRFSDESPPADDVETMGIGKLNLAAASAEQGGTSEEGVVMVEAPPSSPSSSFRCRRCRAPLATSSYLVPHTPASHPGTACAHIHITPLSWMRPELEQGKLEGRLFCPNKKCGQSVGRYAWQGMKCSCGEWVVPGMTLGRGRVDEVRSREREWGRAEGKM